jgi:hypothetical protein
VPTRQPTVVEFHETRRAPIVARMAAMVDAGAGWVNFSPGLDVDEPPPDRTALGSLLASRGPVVPLATWAPPQGREPASAGIQHAQGPRAVATLAERGVALPAGWRVRQDHPRRGLIVVPTGGSDAGAAARSPSDESALDEVLDWLLRAAGALCPVRRTGEWRAYCYER